MNTRIQRAIAARHEALKDGDKGFTLIELLVVVIIIGILAAIAIPVYIGVQNNAKDSEVQSDVANLKTAVVSIQTSGTTPTWGATATKTLPTTPDWKGAGATVGTDDSGLFLKYNATASTFCVSGLSSTGSVFYATDANGVQKAASTVKTAEAACP